MSHLPPLRRAWTRPSLASLAWLAPRRSGQPRLRLYVTPSTQPLVRDPAARANRSFWRPLVWGRAGWGLAGLGLGGCSLVVALLALGRLGMGFSHGPVLDALATPGAAVAGACTLTALVLGMPLAWGGLAAGLLLVLGRAPRSPAWGPRSRGVWVATPSPLGVPALRAPVGVFGLVRGLGSCPTPGGRAGNRVAPRPGLPLALPAGRVLACRLPATPLWGGAYVNVVAQAADQATLSRVLQSAWARHLEVRATAQPRWLDRSSGGHGGFRPQAMGLPLRVRVGGPGAHSWCGSPAAAGRATPLTLGVSQPHRGGAVRLVQPLLAWAPGRVGVLQ